MPLPCLEALHREGVINGFEGTYKGKRAEFDEMIKAVEKAGGQLARANVDYAFHKTVRPYRSTTVDIDTLVFGGKGEYDRAIQEMLGSGYELVERGPRSTTIWDVECNIGVDLYEEIAVSYITYLDKDTLTDHIVDLVLPNGRSVRHLDSAADMAALIAHSVMKEQMYTLSEFYSYVHYLKSMSIDDFLQILEKNCVTSAAKTHTSLNAMVYSIAYGKETHQMEKISDFLGTDVLEMNRLAKHDLQIPHKYHPLTVTRSLLETAKRKKTRDSMAFQIYSMGNPGFTKKFLRALLGHAVRGTY